MHALYTGGVLQAIAFPIKTGPVGNGIAIWLGIEPADLFLYIFLPPMLVDSAVRIDYFIFRKVCILGSNVDTCNVSNRNNVYIFRRNFEVYIVQVLSRHCMCMHTNDLQHCDQTTCCTEAGFLTYTEVGFLTYMLH